MDGYVNTVEVWGNRQCRDGDITDLGMDLEHDYGIAIVTIYHRVD